MFPTRVDCKYLIQNLKQKSTHIFICWSVGNPIWCWWLNLHIFFKSCGKDKYFSVIYPSPVWIKLINIFLLGNLLSRYWTYSEFWKNH
jgi:hypothetical protein